MSIAQGLPDGYGSFYANANVQDYWDGRNRDMNFQFGYTNSYKSLSYNVALNRLRDIPSGDWDNQLSVSLSIPLGTHAGAPRLSSSYSILVVAVQYKPGFPALRVRIINLAMAYLQRITVAMKMAVITP